MTEPSSSTADPQSHRSLVSWLVFPLALFPLVALLTYDWHAIAALNTPPARSANWIGALGDGFAYYGYAIFGLAIWAVPLLCLAAAFCLIRAGRLRLSRRSLWFAAFLLTISCLMQVTGNHAVLLAAAADRMNVPHTGGAIGYLLMTRALSPLLSDFGAAVVILILMIVSLIAAIGLRNILNGLTALYQWTMRPSAIRPEEQEPPSDTEQNVPQGEAEDPFRAVREAREAAKAAAREEKERLKAEKEAARLAAREEKERLKAERAAEKAAHGHMRLWGGGNNDPLPPVAPPATVQPPPARPAKASEPSSQQQTPLPDKGPYILPSLALLNPLKKSAADHSDVGEMSEKLLETLKIFGVDASLAYTVQGPVVTKYAIQLAPGVKYSVVTNIENNIKGALHAKSLRIEAPIPGEECIGIEVPNRAPAGISFREIFESDAWKGFKGELPLLFGKRADGKELIADLASMPHMLVAGATGQGKSVCLNSLICGLLMTKTPEQMKLIMVDPKMVEFTPYASIPHLIVPVITDNKKVVFSLHWAVAEMEKRLKLFARARVRNIHDFNNRPQVTQTDMFGNDSEVGSDMPKTVPYIIIIIDEAADLIGQCGKEVNPDIQRITQKARAAGIHLILATQRPDAKIITGAIKANIPGRVAFKTSSSVDSRTILDEAGAENLIGKGDMLFRGKDGLLVRAQGAWISDDEISNINHFIEQHSNVQFDERFTKKLGTIKEEEVDIFADPEAEAQGAKEEAAAAREQVKADAAASDFKKAVECIINTRRASTSHFQRQMGWGYNHAAKILDMLEAKGIVSPQSGMGPRQIAMDQDQLLAIFNGEDPAASSDGDASGAPDEAEAPTADFDATTETLQPTSEENT